MSEPIHVLKAFEGLKFLANRTPTTGEAAAKDSFKRLCDYRNGGVFIATFAGRSEWERHPHGDELVMVMEGEAVIALLEGEQEVLHTLRLGELIVVPQNAWHRFETQGVKLLTLTPQPTDHSSAAIPSAMPTN
ncbi:MAG: cupin domain-containing protein [Pseudomonadales bacterium]